MAEISTIARPYAEGLFKALQERGASTEDHKSVLAALEGIYSVISRKEVSELIGDPRLTSDVLMSLVKGVGIEEGSPAEALNLLNVVLENGRIEAWPEVISAYRDLINESEGVADAYIESAFDLSEPEVESLLAALSRRFPGKKLVPHVTVNAELIGGVRIRVGDQVLDDSISARLAEMKIALTA